MRYHPTCIRVAAIKITEKNNVAREMEKLKPKNTVGKKVKQCSHYKKTKTQKYSMEIPQKI